MENPPGTPGLGDGGLRARGHLRSMGTIPLLGQQRGRVSRPRQRTVEGAARWGPDSARFLSSHVPGLKVTPYHVALN